MKKQSVILMFIFYFVLALGCVPAYDQEVLQEMQLENKPIKISEHEGVIVWKVRDTSPGGVGYVYYTTSKDKESQILNPR